VERQRRGGETHWGVGARKRVFVAALVIVTAEGHDLEVKSRVHPKYKTKYREGYACRRSLLDTRGPSRRESCCAAQTWSAMLALAYFDRSAEIVRHRSSARPRRM